MDIMKLAGANNEFVWNSKPQWVVLSELVCCCPCKYLTSLQHHIKCHHLSAHCWGADPINWKGTIYTPFISARSRGSHSSPESSQARFACQASSYAWNTSATPWAPSTCAATTTICYGACGRSSKCHFCWCTRGKAQKETTVSHEAPRMQFWGKY